MAMADVMDDVDYKIINFNVDEAEHRHPLWLTESHFIYNLYRDEGGHLNCHRNASGDPLRSPRPLSKMCMNEIIREGSQIPTFDMESIPADLYPSLLSEAIFQRQVQAIGFLVSTWPHSVLDLQSIMPKEDLVEPTLLTIPIEGHDGTTFLDCIMCGLLRKKESSRLKTVNLSGFKQDRTLCREICRLPILWMSPDDRTVDNVYNVLSRTLEITEEKVERYLNRIRCIYANVDPDVPHGKSMPTTTIVLDCKITLDDVCIGLALQDITPFRFVCQRLWLEPVSEVNLPLNLLSRIFDPRELTNLEIEYRDLCCNEANIDIFIEGVSMLPNLKCLSLPNTIHCVENEEVALKLNGTLRRMTALRRLNFTLCNLKGNLGFLLSGLEQPLTFLSLKDCRLSHTDILFLLEWQLTTGLLDLNLSRNNLQSSLQDMILLISRLEEIRCLSLAYCCFSPFELFSIIEQISKCQHLKTLEVQSFVPFSESDSRRILKDCCTIPNLQKCFILPDCHAFLGFNELERFEARERYLEHCDNILSHFNRDDIELE